MQITLFLHKKTYIFEQILPKLRVNLHNIVHELKYFCISWARHRCPARPCLQDNSGWPQRHVAPPLMWPSPDPTPLGPSQSRTGYRLSCLHTLDFLQLCPEVVRFDWTRLSPRLKGLGHGLHGTLPPIKRRNEVLFHTKDDQAAPFPAKFSLQPWPAEPLVILPPPLWQKALPYPENMQSVMKTPKRTAPLPQAPRTLLKAPASTTDTDSRWIALQLQPEHVSEAQHIMHDMDISEEWDRGSQDTRTLGGDRLP